MSNHCQYSTKVNSENKDYEMKYSICFKIINGKNILITIDKEKTLSDLIKKFFQCIENYESFEDKNEILLIYNAQTIKFNDMRKVGNFFKNCNFATIYGLNIL